MRTPVIKINTSDPRDAWIVFAVISGVLYGDFYVYDSIGPVADLLQRQRGFSNSQIGMLNAIYNLPNVVLVLLGGVLVDRVGSSRVIVGTACICFVGAALTAFSTGFYGMAAGRLLFGIGAETSTIGAISAIVRHFSRGRIAFAMGSCLALGRAGSFSADMSPMWFADAYSKGWQPPLVIATVIAALSLAAAISYWLVDRRCQTGSTPQLHATQVLAVGDLLRFGAPYWFLLALCVLWYGVIFAFRSTFSIKYFQHAHGLDLATAGAVNSYVFLAAIFTTPAFGWLSDRTGRYKPMLAFGALLLPVSIVIMGWTQWSLWIGSALIGVSFSMVPAVMWPLASKIVQRDRFGTALGLMWVMQNAGIAGANLVAGRLNDIADASRLNPGGYHSMMLFFAFTSAFGFMFSIALWLSTDLRRV